MKPQQERTSLIARFLAGFLIAGQLAWELPAEADDALRQGQERETRSAGLEETLKGAAVTGLEEKTEPLPKTEAVPQLERFLDAMQKGMAQNGGYQRGNIVDLRELPPDKRIVFVGDLHSYGGILQRVLEREGLEDENSILILSGDAVHWEDESEWAEMDSSVGLMQRLMELKIRYPTRIYYMLGNHDRPTLAVQRNWHRGSFKIGQAYFSELERWYGVEYVAKYSKFLIGSPILLVADGLVFVHAGPILGAGLGRVQAADMSSFLKPVSEMDPIIHQAVDGGDYNGNSVKQFLRDLGLPENTLILTSHFHLPTAWWHRKLLEQTGDPTLVNKVHNIYAGIRSKFGRWGYARYQNSTLEIVKFTNGQPDGIEKYPSAGMEEAAENSEQPFGQAYLDYIRPRLQRYSGRRVKTQELPKLLGVSQQVFYQHKEFFLGLLKNASIQFNEHRERVADPAKAIEQVLEKHPGGLISPKQLAKRAKISEQTLRRHNYQAMRDLQNQHRVTEKPPRRKIYFSVEEAVRDFLQTYPGGLLTMSSLARGIRIPTSTVSRSKWREWVKEQNDWRAAANPPGRPIYLSVEEAILGFLRQHPGVPTAEKLVKGTGVSYPTLLQYNYRALIAAERPAEQGGAVTGAGLEEDTADRVAAFRAELLEALRPIYPHLADGMHVYGDGSVPDPVEDLVTLLGDAEEAYRGGRLSYGRISLQEAWSILEELSRYPGLIGPRADQQSYLEGQTGLLIEKLTTIIASPVQVRGLKPFQEPPSFPGNGHSGLEEYQADALAKLWVKAKAATPEMKWVVIGPSVAAQFGLIEYLAFLEQEHILIDRNPLETLQHLKMRGAQVAHYYGTSGEAEQLKELAERPDLKDRFRVAILPQSPQGATFIEQLREILVLLNVPSDVISGGLEEFAARLEAVQTGA